MNIRKITQKNIVKKYQLFLNNYKNKILSINNRINKSYSNNKNIKIICSKNNSTYKNN